MTDSGTRLLEAGRNLIGVRFRLHGRHPEAGLDCLGVVGWAIAQVTGAVCLPVNYGLRQQDRMQFLPLAANLGLIEQEANLVPPAGDVVLFDVGPWQSHLGISDGDGAIIHAHAGLSREVHGLPDPEWTVLRQWRLDPNIIK